MKNKEWFVDWFDTKWYHQLYKNRDEQEAQWFIDALVGYLAPDLGSHFLDLACGKGRHAAYLAAKGFDVVGVDLSKASILAASQLAHDSLRFAVHDMRDLYLPAQFDYVLNLFTSFGYFGTDEEHVDVLANMRDSLRKNGRVVLDFLNAPKVASNLIVRQVVEVDDVQFKIQRKLESGYVIKTIKVIDGSQEHTFFERVRLFTLDDFYRIFAQAGLDVIQVFGDYNLNPLTKDSPRLILVAKALDEYAG